jgi:hypothetical protein
MVLGAGVIALASAGSQEQHHWREAAARESARYGVDDAYTRSRGLGQESSNVPITRSWIDWLVVACATAVFIALGAVATAPQIALRASWAVALSAAMVALFVGCGALLWRTTRFV